MLPFIIFGASLAALVKASDIFIDIAEKIGKRLGMPHFIVGIVVIGLGTSLPELASSLTAIAQSTPENTYTTIVTANVIGSNIANILLGVGIASLFRVVKVSRELIDTDLPFLFASTAIGILFLMDGVLSRGEGIMLLAMFILFIAFSLFDENLEDEIEEEEKAVKVKRKESLVKLFSFLALACGAIIISSDFTIKGLIGIVDVTGIGKDIASMVLLALGTSFPEIFVSVMAVRKKKFAMALGNIFGSNIGNMLGILGISAVITPLAVSEKSILIGLPFIGVATLFFIFTTMDNRVRKWEGFMAIGIFLAFFGKLFGVF